MPAASNPVLKIWKPLGPGKGGQFTNATYHDMDPESTNRVVDAVVDKNSWRVRYNDVQYGATTGSLNAATLEIFNRYSGLSQTLVSSLIAGFTAPGSNSYVQNMTSGAAIRTNATPLPLGTGGGRFSFATVKNRLYMANGTDSPAISPDGTASSCIPWGFAPQTPVLQYQIVASGSGNNAGVLGGSQGTATVTTLTTLTWVSGVKFDYFLAGAVIYVNGVFNTIAIVNSTTVLTLTYNAVNNVGIPFSYAPTAMIGNANYTGANGAVPGLNTLATWAPPGALPVFIVGPGPPPMWPPAGSPAFIAAVASPSEPAIKYTLTGVTGANAGTISPTYAEQTAGALVTRNTQINFSSITFDNGRSYQYAVSYFNPTSGHVSNPSTILNVKDGAPNNINVSVTILNIITTNDPNYTKIILWRSAANGANLFPLAILNNNNGNAAGNTITYTDFLGDDTALGTASGGPGKLSAPRGENTQPPADLNYIAYWDGRFWGASQTQIGILFFSARSSPGNAEDISVGVGEECWPPSFTRAVPESDGRITGLRTVGNNLFVLTDNNIYAVVGTNAQNYGLSRVSGKGHGTSHFLTAVLPSEDTNSSDVLVHYGNDGRLYFLFGSGGDFPVSYPIQDQLNTDRTGGLIPTVVGVQHTATSTYVVLADVFFVFLYDVERKIWLQRTMPGGLGATAYVEGLLNGQVVQMFGSKASVGEVFQAEQQSGSAPNFTITTNTVSPGGDNKDEKILQSVAVYYPNRTDTIIVTADIYTGTITFTEVPNTGQYAAWFPVSDTRIFVPTTSMARGRLFSVSVSVFSPSSFANAVYEIRALFSDATSPEARGGNL